jgi:hypothetical protein
MLGKAIARRAPRGPRLLSFLAQDAEEDTRPLREDPPGQRRSVGFKRAHPWIAEADVLPFTQIRERRALEVLRRGAPSAC